MARRTEVLPAHEGRRSFPTYDGEDPAGHYGYEIEVCDACGKYAERLHEIVSGDVWCPDCIEEDGLEMDGDGIYVEPDATPQLGPDR